MTGLTGWHLVILVIVVGLLFGAQRLPGIARALGQSARIFKGEMKATTDEEHIRSPQQAPAGSPAIEQPPHSVTPADPHTPPSQASAVQRPTSDTTHPPAP
jgi:sec-independent protein translocase protein TatA